MGIVLSFANVREDITNKERHGWTEGCSCLEAFGNSFLKIKNQIRRGAYTARSGVYTPGTTCRYTTEVRCQCVSHGVCVGQITAIPLSGVAEIADP